MEIYITTVSLFFFGSMAVIAVGEPIALLKENTRLKAILSELEREKT